ncbi:arginyl-tRNA synthetase [Seinonella peptonophila]|uniref:Arginine--tRNA ligase n=1 Tax=Seinonella peptonophila TaxID=112248 RepID=A0A1M4TSD9_9BACL|nr:arginine--tRNA ligase [Seinonella peptonophila]SHE47382.1 arginyl-tRNA synthetase [Seinonella peptonophila]
MDHKLLFAKVLHEQGELPFDIQTIKQLIETPKRIEMGDFAFPCFALAKHLRKSPAIIAQELQAKITDPIFDHLEAVGPYLNLFLNQEKVSQHIFKQIMEQGSDYGRNQNGKGGTVTIDLSAPNIAKPFSMGHLRSTVIGNAIANLADKNGYQPFRINYIGDWGTQFGKLIVAYRKWGNAESIQQNPITELLKLYIRFHEEAENNPRLEEEGRKAFKALEDGEPEAIQLWKQFRDESLKEFSRIYDLLGVHFDSFQGESFYNDKMDEVVEILQEKGLLVESQQAQVVKLDEEEMPPCLIRKSDGATLYATRDLASALYRKRTYHFVRSLYVVGNEQSLHFKQLKAVLKKAAYAWADEMEHISFGMMLKNGKKMSTRKGRIILLEEVLQEAIERTETIINEKNPNLSDKAQVAKQVGPGAVIFHDLKHHRTNDVEFSFEHMLNFDGETGPYLQYAYARCKSLLRKANFTPSSQVNGVTDEQAWPIVRLISDFPNVIRTAWNNYDPSKIARFALDLARSLNQFYAHVHILSDPDHQQERLHLIYSTAITLKESLRLLGLKAPEEM